MSITYAGEPLLLEDDNFQITNWIDRNIDLESMRLFGGMIPDRAIGRSFTSRLSQDFEFPAGYMNWPTVPKLRINALYWPTGASRFGFGMFLVSAEALERIKETITDSSNDYAELILREPNRSRSITTNMYLLESRTLTATPGKVLHLIALVDDRYFMSRYQPVVELVTKGEIDKTSPWSDVFTELNTWDPIFSNDPVATEYLECNQPSYHGFVYDEHRGASIDSVAGSVGQRFVKDLDGTTQIIDWTTSQTRLDANLAAEHKLTAGGIEDANVWPIKAPSEVSVYFRKSLHSQTQFTLGKTGTNDSAFQRCQYSATDVSDLTDDDTFLGTHRIYSTAFYAVESGDSWEDNADNFLEINSLGEKIAEDYYTSIKHSYDYVFTGLQDWSPTGWDDYIIWEFGSRQDEESPGPYPKGEYRAFTRVMTLPRDVSPTVMTQQSANFFRHIPGGLVTCELTTVMSSVAVGNTTAFRGTAKFISQDETGEFVEDSTRTFFIYDMYGIFEHQAEIGDKFHVRGLSPDTPEFFVIVSRFDRPFRPLVRFTLDSALAIESSSQDATITEQYGAGADNPDTSITVLNLQVSSGSNLFEGDAGDVGLAYHDSGQNYIIIQMECP